ncbi:Uncharacterized protein Rs2_40949 [Raphanus sativus]|nr:Uncharacterized protein Rs2_40949 [Raphanus sativus]
MPVWFDPNVWAGLVTYWLDPGTEVRSCNSRAACYSDPDGHVPSKHRSGQTSFKAHARIILAPRKKGRIYGVGSLSQSVGSVSASFPSSSSSEGQSLKKIIKEQALVIQSQGNVIQSQGNEIGRLSAAIRYLATKDSTLANILQSEDVPSHNSEGMSHGSRDDESDAI